jgi:hypothetical protein
LDWIVVISFGQWVVVTDLLDVGALCWLFSRAVGVPSSPAVCLQAVVVSDTSTQCSRGN